MKTVIALTYTNNEQKHENYVRWLKQAGNVDVLTLSAANDNIAHLKNCQGVVFSGGTDVHPSFYGSKTKDYPHAPKKFDRTRDEFEKQVFQYSQELSMPVLAICRGMQLVNILLGGKMIQDLGKTGNTIHKAANGRDKAHGLQIKLDTMLYGIVARERLVVNAAHHQAVGRPGKGLRVNATADDGTVEGIEWEDPAGKPFLLGVQWHPERLFAFGLQDSPASAAIRGRFLQEVTKTQ